MLLLSFVQLGAHADHLPSCAHAFQAILAAWLQESLATVSISDLCGCKWRTQYQDAWLCSIQSFAAVPGCLLYPRNIHSVMQLQRRLAAGTLMCVCPCSFLWFQMVAMVSTVCSAQQRQLAVTNQNRCYIHGFCCHQHQSRTHNSLVQLNNKQQSSIPWASVINHRHQSSVPQATVIYTFYTIHLQMTTQT